MIFTMNRDALAHAAQVAGKVASRGTTPAAACALLEADGGSCSFSATDGDQFVRHEDMAMVEDPGRRMVSAMALGKAVKSLPDGAVTVDDSGGRVSVSCGKSRFELPSLDAREWAGAPYSGDGPACKADAAALLDACKRVAPFAAGDKEAREFLKGVHVVSDGSSLKLEATDSYRVAVAEIPAGGDALDALVPTAFLLRACESMFGDVEMSSDGKRVRLSCGPTETGARCLAYKYPDITRAMSVAGGGASFPRGPMLDALKRACQLGNGTSGLSLDASGGECRVSADAGDAGSFEDFAPCDGEFSFFGNSQILRACVEAVDADSVTVAVGGAKSPAVFSGGSVRALAMPMVRTGR